MNFREDEKEFTAVRERLEALVYTPVGSLAMEAYWSKEPLPFERRTEGRYFVPVVGETWGELYFERHQGTYTSIAKSKKYNRFAEQSLHTLEWLSVLAEIKCGIPYPAEEIRRFYQEILLYQFHDCLPGSSIRRVYDEAYARYEMIAKETGKLARKRMEALAVLLAEDGTVCFNPAPVDREEYADVFGKEAKCTLPAYGISVVSTEGAVPWKEEKTLQKSPYELENSKIFVQFTERGTISKLILKENGFNLIREGGEGNRLVLYPDELTHWDINKDYLKAKPEEAVLTAAKPFTLGSAAGIRLEFATGSSVIHQKVILRKDSARLDFETEVEWKEEYKMLRTQFPVSVVTDHASCEIQFGHLTRPTHANTSWNRRYRCLRRRKNWNWNFTHLRYIP